MEHFLVVRHLLSELHIFIFNGIGAFLVEHDFLDLHQNLFLTLIVPFADFFQRLAQHLVLD